MAAYQLAGHETAPLVAIVLCNFQKGNSNSSLLMSCLGDNFDPQTEGIVVNDAIGKMII